MFLHPADQAACCNRQATSLRDQTRSGLCRVAEVIESDSLQNDGQREGLVAEWLGREDLFAIIATPQLDSLEFFLAYAFAYNLSAAAIRTLLDGLADTKSWQSHI